MLPLLPVHASAWSSGGIDVDEVIQTYTVRILLEGEAAAEADHLPHPRRT